MKPYHQQRGIEVYCGDVRDVLAELPEQSVQMCVTSPPYWALRSYLADDHPDKAKELGSEPTPEEYVANMVEVFRGVWRVLRDDGTCWVNMGDGYNANQGAGFNAHAKTRSHLTGEGVGQKRIDTKNRNTTAKRPANLKPKDLIGMPWRLAFALQSDGWYLRQDIIWAKPNPMPESVRDRCTKAHEYLFLLTKRPRYFFDADAIREAAEYGRREQPAFRSGQQNGDGHRSLESGSVTGSDPSAGRNRRSVWTMSLEEWTAIWHEAKASGDTWTIPSESFPGAHFATFPRRLIEPCVMAGTSDKGCCPECGMAWVRVVSTERVRTRPGKDSKTYDRTTGEVTDDGEEKPWRDQAEIGKRDPGRHVTDTTTLGWKPCCKCYGLEIIEVAPVRPGKKKDESWAANEKRLVAWRIATKTWLRRWAILKPQYDAQQTIPCTILDPFHGAGTTAVVAKSLGRRYIGIELNPEYIDLSIPRLRSGASGPKKQQPANGQAELF